jgi:peptide deformylase
MILPIVKYGNPILRAKGKPIAEVDSLVRSLASDMLETMHDANGIGLAAQQVGAALQLTVLDISQVEDRPSTLRLNDEDIDPAVAMPLVLVNPRIQLSDEISSGSEGCLSFPEITAEIDRAEAVEVEAETLEGETIRLQATGLLARALQHEVDHLNGILFIDRMDSATKASLSSRLKRLQKETMKVEALRR